jgi:hypothetical protein
MLTKIISGGQTGADRAALDAGIESGFPVGGSCPFGRMAEDGPIDLRYPLDELEGGYEARTKKNVEDSSATVVFYHGYLQGGTQLSVAYCMELEKAYKLIDIDLVSTEIAATKVIEFISDNKIRVLNVAGPRASSCPPIYDFVRNTMLLVIDKTSAR